MKIHLLLKIIFFPLWGILYLQSIVGYMSKTLSSETSVTVKFHDCDPLGIVWHGNYIKYFEEAREGFGKKYEFDYLEIFHQGFSTPIVRVECDYKKPLRYRDIAIVKATIHRTDAAKIIFDYEIRKLETNEVIAVGRTVQVLVNAKTMELQLNTPELIMDWKRKVGWA